MKKNLVIIAARGLGDLIYHLPLLRSLYESYNEKLIILANKVNKAKDVYKNETFYENYDFINLIKGIYVKINFNNLVTLV